MKFQLNLRKLIISAVVIGVGIAATLFNHWEPSEETWGYWFFARVFAETGKFVIIDRSPLYILYLNLFSWIGYPWSVTIEYIMTTVILTSALTALLKRYMSLWWAVFVILLWLPFFQISEPPVQKLALVCVCFAVFLRGGEISRLKMFVSYTLLGAVYFLRNIYVIFPIIFAVWDISNILKNRKMKGLFSVLKPGLNDWPILILLILLMMFNFRQSSHPWNNAWFSSTQWFPGNGKKLADAGYIQYANWQYIYYKYGTYKDHDFYFTNKDLFKGATDIVGAMRVNPRFAIGRLLRNIKETFCVVAGFTMLPNMFYEKVLGLEPFYYFGLILVTIPFVLAMIYGAFRATLGSKTMRMFIIGCIIIMGINILALPRPKYSYSLIPLIMLSAFWYGSNIKNVFEKKTARLPWFSKISFLAGNSIVMPFVFIFFSNGLLTWSKITFDIVNSAKQKETIIMQTDGYSLKASFDSLRPLVKDCKGVLLYEHNFFGAFMDTPISNIYDIWEIPPFGNLSDSKYNGLRPERIDCVLLSDTLATTIGAATNCQMRYDNYIKPYIEYLKNEGAVEYPIERFGKAVIFPKNKKGVL